jgi:hypothetical protein
MRFVGAVLATAVAATFALAPSAASADSVTRRDAVGDVAQTPVGTIAYAPAPARSQGDIRSTKVAHARAIWVIIRFRELSTNTNGNFHRIGIRSDRRTRFIEIDAFPGRWDGHAVTTTKRGRVVPCGVRHHIDYDRNRIVVRVPRGCLGRPTWVRVGIRSTVAGATKVFTDDALATGYTPELVYGPHVRQY